MSYSQRQIHCDASMVIFTSVLSLILVSTHSGYLREQIKDKNSVKAQTILIVLIAQNMSIFNTMEQRILND